MIAVFDNAIQDDNILKRINTNWDTIFGDPGVYKYWDGWWNSPINNTTKEIIEYLWGERCPLGRSYDISGFEYWTGIQTAQEYDQEWADNLPIHFDKDEAWWRETGEVVSPVIGSVYYPPGQRFTGGELAIYTDGRDSTPEIIKAKPNRFVIFGAGRDLHMVQQVTSGKRNAIAINLWESEPYSKQKGILTIE